MKSAIDGDYYTHSTGSMGAFHAEMACAAAKEDNFCSPVAESDPYPLVQHFSVEKTRSGIAMVMLHHMGNAMFFPQAQLEFVQLLFFSVFSGQADVWWGDEEAHGRASLTPGNYVLACGPGSYAISMKPGAPCKIVGIAFSPETLQTILGPDDTLSMDLSRFRPGTGGACVCWKDSIPSAQVSLAGDQLLGCGMTGWGRQLYLESKATELLSVYLGMLQGQRLGFGGFAAGRDLRKLRGDGLSGEDIQKLHDARTMLVERMPDPPGISELSRLCCINEFKLKKGFKKVFGQTVFKVLRKERMARAKRLIGEGYSVSNAAYEVGYSSVSKFITAFKGEYGITPGGLSLKKKSLLPG